MKTPTRQGNKLGTSYLRELRLQETNKASKSRKKNHPYHRTTPKVTREKKAATQTTRKISFLKAYLSSCKHRIQEKIKQEYKTRRIKKKHPAKRKERLLCQGELSTSMYSIV